MKRYYFQILLACCLTLFAGCSDSDSESGQNGIPKGSKAIDLQQEVVCYVIPAWVGDFMTMQSAM